MSLLDVAKADIEQITSDPDGFTRQMIFTAPGGLKANVRGLYSEHHLAVDNDGRPVNSKNSHVSVTEKQFIDLNYPYKRNGEINFSKHLVKVTVNAQGETIVYQVRDWFPSKTVGLITFILSSYSGQNTADATDWTADSTLITADSE